MNHRDIDEQSVADRYLCHALSPEERRAFESHLVNCPECVDRLLLASMFHARNGKQPEWEPIPFFARFIAQFTPWQLVLILLGAALFLLAVPTVYFLWQLALMNGHGV